MEKIKKALSSRTVWMVVALFVINGITGVQDLLPVAWLPYINSFVGILAIYFKVNPSQKY